VASAATRSADSAETFGVACCSKQQVDYRGVCNGYSWGMRNWLFLFHERLDSIVPEMSQAFSGVAIFVLILFSLYLLFLGK